MPDATFGLFNNDLGAGKTSRGHSHASPRRSSLRTPAQEAELKRIAENISESPYAILVIDAEGRIALANGAADSVFHCHSDEIVGQRIDVLSRRRQGADLADEIDTDLLVQDVINAVSLPDHILIETALRVPRLYGVRTAVATSLYDLLGNAVRQCVREDSRIAVTCDEDAGHCVFTIADCSVAPGTGENEHPPTTGANTARRPGVDVAETRKLIEAHGGRLAVDAATATHGATYRISWPLAGY